LDYFIGNASVMKDEAVINFQTSRYLSDMKHPLWLLTSRSKNFGSNIWQHNHFSLHVNVNWKLLIPAMSEYIYLKSLQ
jgi:hypothetical protein